MKPKNYKTHDALIASYLEAFKLANPLSGLPDVRAEKGYILIGHGGAKYAAAHVEEMRQNLLERYVETNRRNHGPKE
jgi:hypothetical protein